MFHCEKRWYLTKHTLKTITNELNMLNQIREKAAKPMTLLCLFSAGLYLLLGQAALAKSDSSVLPEYVYTAHADPLQQAKDTLQKAKKQNKLALLVLGAEWCHDSVGLASNFSKPEMQTILAAQFETTFIDVGYLEDRRDVTSFVGYPNYFATPTVLIVNPDTNDVINVQSLRTWQSAYSVEFDEYISYFSQWKKESVTAGTSTNTTSASNDALALFEKQQSARLQDAYKILGPMLEASDDVRANKDTELAANYDKDTFYALWDEVKVFRTSVQKSIHEMRNQTNLDTKAVEKLNASAPQKQSWE
jgi:hypothetical protein